MGISSAEYPPVYFAEAVYGEKPRIQCAKPHLSDEVHVISGHPTRIKPEYNPPIGRFLPFSAHFLKNLMPFGPLRRQRRHFYDNLAGSHARSNAEMEKKTAAKQSHLESLSRE